ncbi:hypothetical protein [Thiohalocapsa sp. ML1]|jgi:septation ring formation regulator EzrA|uniref:hypothetical protein n=1 Tax=Thiohalocapsa sp. ML1 TaxID=1431688 RepID=UPI0007323EDF|nr:hypothetical protein [Thiohalocapsa sp. ML1]
MALAQEDIEFIKDHLGDWLAERSLGKPPAVYEIELRERMVRVEEELRHQRELMREGFAQMEKRLEQIDKRFEQIDKRFEQIDKRFEQVDKRFEQVDKRFESIQADMDKRFEAARQDMRELQRRMDRFMLWSFSTTVAVGALVVSLVKFWNP